MKVVVNNSALMLDRWQTVELVDAAGATATVDQGVVWLTMAGDRRDVVLGAGQSFEVSKDGRTLLHAEAPSTVRIVEAPARHPVATLWHQFMDWTERAAVATIEQRRPVPYY